MKLRVGDTVKVRVGKDRGKSGKILQVLPGEGKVVVENVNLARIARKPTQKQPRGGISEQAMPIWSAKVGIVHPTDSKRTSRLGYTLGKDGKKARVYRQADNKEVS